MSLLILIIYSCKAPTGRRRVAHNTYQQVWCSVRLALMQDHIERPLSLADIAKEVACPPKSLSRRFQLELGTSPGVAYRHLRLTQAHKLCENAHLSVGEIALRTGYESPAALTRAFKIRYGRTPRMVRAGALLPSMIRDEV